MPTASVELSFGSYRVESRLGVGGMGEVFLARDERLHRKVAIKRIREDLEVDPRRRERFRREARAVAGLNHPAIVQIFDIVSTDDGDCLVMEYVEGPSLADLLTDGPLDLDQTLRLGTEIAQGLAEAHARGFVHRDLKPENVRLTAAGHAKILDFGLVHCLWRRDTSSQDPLLQDPIGSQTLTEAGALVGTVHAMSPEQASGRPLDHRSDLFALGSLLYQMLSGRPPFQGTNLLDTLCRITAEPPTSLAQLQPRLPADLLQLVEALLAKDPHQRPANASLVAASLERLRSGPGPGTDAGTGPGVLLQPDTSALPRPSGTRRASASHGELDGNPATSEQATGEWFPSPPTGTPAVRTLLHVELLHRAALPQRHGDGTAASLLSRYDRRLRDLVSLYGGSVAEKADSLLAVFERPADAVACALSTQRAILEVASTFAVELPIRAAIHTAEVLVHRPSSAERQQGAPEVEVEGSEKGTACQLLHLAAGNQILLSRTAFDLARRAHPDSRDGTEDGGKSSLRWLAHGSYLLRGRETPLDVFEVGLDGLSALRPPSERTDARRALSVSEERMLGWRPAGGQPIPGRPHWKLEERVGEGGFGEVWLARHKAGEARVFKFCFEAERLRALKREVTLFRLLKEALGQRDDIARILDWNFDSAPFFVEAEYTEGGSLVRWAEQQGGLSQVPLEVRLELAAEVAEALAAAHSVGVLHKDIKPENVLITSDRDGRPRARLTDFGIGLLTDREQLAGQDFTALGFTATATPTTDSGAGTFGYMAPELLAGRPATIQADLYSFGVLLYQLVAADFERPLASGWERDVEEELLVEDIGTLVDGRPERRPASGLIAAEKLYTLEQRRAERATERAARRAAQQAVRRRRRLKAVAVTASIFLVVVVVLALQAMQAKEREGEQRRQAEGLIDFMLFDLQENLEPLGRLDLLDQVAQRALEHFSQTQADFSSADSLRRALTYLNIGWVLEERLDVNQAQAAHEKAVRILAALHEKDPSQARVQGALSRARLRLASVLIRQEKTQEGLDSLASSRLLARQLAGREDAPTEWRLLLGQNLQETAHLYCRIGDFEQGLEYAEEALQIAEDLVLEPTSNWRTETLLVDTLQLFGTLHQARSDFQQGIRALERLRTRLGNLMEGNPTQLTWLRAQAITELDLGNLYLATADKPSALHRLREAERLYQQLIVLDPLRDTWPVALAQTWVGLATALEDQPEIALAYLHRASETFKQVADEHPTYTHLQLWLVVSHAALQDHYKSASKWDLALLEGRTVLRLLQDMPENPQNTEATARTYLELGRIQKQRDEEDLARNSWQKALELAEALPAEKCRILDTRAQSLLELGRIEEALPIVHRLLDAEWSDEQFQTLVDDHELATYVRSAGSPAVGCRNL